MLSEPASPNAFQVGQAEARLDTQRQPGIAVPPDRLSPTSTVVKA
jgi:hypothetical protein